MPKLISTQFIVTESELKDDYYIYKLSTFDDNSKSLKAGFISKWNDLNPLKLSEEEIEARRKSTSFEWLDSGNDTENSNIHFWRNIESIIDATALNSLDDANDWCDIINTAGNPTIGTTVVIKNTDLSRLIEKSYRNLDTLMKELEANGIDTSQLNIIEE